MNSLWLYLLRNEVSSLNFLFDEAKNVVVTEISPGFDLDPDSPAFSVSELLLFSQGISRSDLKSQTSSLLLKITFLGFVSLASCLASSASA